MSEQLKEILEQRGAEYGDFKVIASFSQDLRRLFLGYMQKHNPERLEFLQPYMLETLQMFGTKLGRIACGNPFNEDSWRDIAGYADLTANLVHGDVEEAKARAIAAAHEEARKQAQEEAPETIVDPDVPEAHAGGAGPKEKTGESSVDAELHEHTHEHGDVELINTARNVKPADLSAVGIEPEHTKPLPHVSGNI